MRPQFWLQTNLSHERGRATNQSQRTVGTAMSLPGRGRTHDAEDLAHQDTIENGYVVHKPRQRRGEQILGGDQQLHTQHSKLIREVRLPDARNKEASTGGSPKDREGHNDRAQEDPHRRRRRPRRQDLSRTHYDDRTERAGGAGTTGRCTF